MLYLMFCKNTIFFVFCKGKAGKNLYIYDNEEGFIYDNTDNLDNFFSIHTGDAYLT